jgi:hypothetical protein
LNTERERERAASAHVLCAAGWHGSWRAQHARSLPSLSVCHQCGRRPTQLTPAPDTDTTPHHTTPYRAPPTPPRLPRPAARPQVVQQCVATEGVEPEYVKTEVLPEFFSAFWQRRMALDRRNYRALVETTVALANKARCWAPCFQLRCGGRCACVCVRARVRMCVRKHLHASARPIMSARTGTHSRAHAPRARVAHRARAVTRRSAAARS